MMAIEVWREMVFEGFHDVALIELVHLIAKCELSVILGR